MDGIRSTLVHTMRKSEKDETIEMIWVVKITFCGGKHRIIKIRHEI